MTARPVDDLHVFSIPLRTRFRGITVREGVLLRGEAGWGEWSPFLEYDDATARPWLACAREAADVGWPEPLRDAVPVNVTVPEGRCRGVTGTRAGGASASRRTPRPAAGSR